MNNAINLFITSSRLLTFWQFDVFKTFRVWNPVDLFFYFWNNNYVDCRRLSWLVFFLRQLTKNFIRFDSCTLVKVLLCVVDGSVFLLIGLMGFSKDVISSTTIDFYFLELLTWISFKRCFCFEVSYFDSESSSMLYWRFRILRSDIAMCYTFFYFHFSKWLFVKRRVFRIF